MNKSRLKISLLIIMVMIIASSSIASADIGPKPALDIYVYGMDSDGYWLDLLVKDDADHSWLDITEEEKLRVKKLADYEDDEGFHPALLKGTYTPLWGDLKGVKQSDGSYLHEFGYVGVPDTFKIAILKDDGTLIISDTIHRSMFQTVMKYDLRNIDMSKDVVHTQKLVKERIPYGKATFDFSIRLVLTVVIEMLLALLFMFRKRETLKTILHTNIITQVVLNVIIISSYLMGGLFNGIIFFFLAEIVVVVIELNVYLRRIDEKGKVRVVIYTLLANILTICAGFVLFFIH